MTRGLEKLMQHSIILNYVEYRKLWTVAQGPVSHYL
jgi:hypothetical protein